MLSIVYVRLFVELLGLKVDIMDDLEIGEIVEVLGFDEEQNKLATLTGSVGSLSNGIFVLECQNGYYEGISVASITKRTGKNVFDEMEDYYERVS